MSYQQRTITVSLVSYLLILGFYLIRLFQIIAGEDFNSTKVFALWAIVVVFTILVTILAVILTHILSSIIQARKTKEKPRIENIQDERDRLVDLRGTKITYFAFSIGVFLSMLTFALGQPPLVMFSMLIFFGLLAQIMGDSSRLVLYRRGW